METGKYKALISLISDFLSEFEWITNRIIKNKGQLSLPKDLFPFFSRPELPAWSSHYESSDRLHALPLFSFFEVDDLMTFAKEVESLSTEEKSQFIEEAAPIFNEFFDQLDTEIDSFKKPTKREINEYLTNTPEEQRQNDIVKAYFFWTTFVTQVFQYLAFITYGESMCSLVEKAKSGDNLSFCRAVSIDRTVLFGIPYFQQKLASLQLGNERALLNSLADEMSREKLPTRFNYPELNIVFAILQQQQMLHKLSNQEVLAICEELDVYYSDDPSLISKQKTRFLKRQGHQS